VKLHRSQRRRWLGLATAVASVAAILAVITPSNASVTSYAMIGDSITWQAQDHLRAAIPGARIDGVIGRSFPQADEALAEIMEGGVPNVLIVALGTNPTLTLAQIDAFMPLTDPIDRVIFVNIRIPREWEAPTNELIASLPSRYPKVSVIDWYGYTATRPYLLNDTGYHLTDAGKPEYAKFIADMAFRAVGRCLPGEIPTDDSCIPVGRFIDDDWSPFEADIEWIADGGVTKGCNPPANDRFCPEALVTRGQMAAFLVRALGLTDGGGGDRFVDDDDSIFAADIDRLAVAGVTRGCNPPMNDRFCPDRFVTRGQMAAFLVRSFDLTDDGNGDRFVDDDDSIFAADIDRLAVAGVTRGCDPPANDRFCPKDRVTREQMAAFLHRALDT
jgi:hypothetical protein